MHLTWKKVETCRWLTCVKTKPCSDEFRIGHLKPAVSVFGWKITNKMFFLGDFNTGVNCNPPPNPPITFYMEDAFCFECVVLFVLISTYSIVNLKSPVDIVTLQRQTQWTLDVIITIINMHTVPLALLNLSVYISNHYQPIHTHTHTHLTQWAESLSSQCVGTFHQSLSIHQHLNLGRETMSAFLQHTVLHTNLILISNCHLIWLKLWIRLDCTSVYVVYRSARIDVDVYVTTRYLHNHCNLSLTLTVTSKWALPM